MAGHGRGRKIGYDAAISMSLDEVISVQKSEETSTAGVSRQQAESMSLGDIIVAGRGRGRVVNRGAGGYRPRPAPIPAPMEVEGDRIIPLGATLAQGSMRRYTDDVFKPLDEVVSTRGIPKPPPSYKNDRANGALPITGRRNMTSGRESQASGNGTDSIGRAHSVDPLGLMQNGFEENRGNGNQRKRTFSDDEGAENETGLGQNTQKKQRVVSSDNIRGPFMAVQYLQQVGMNIKVRFALRSAKDQVPTRKWRAIVSSGSIQGMAESNRKQVSREMACFAFLRSLKVSYPKGVIPPYEIEPELTLDPKVMSDITTIAKERELHLTVDTEFVNGKGHVSTFNVDGVEFKDSDLELQYAQLKTAYTVYEYLTGKPYDITEIFIDDQCDLDAVYNFEQSVLD